MPESHGYSMINGPLLVAPAGGTIGNVQRDGDASTPLIETSLYGHDVWAGELVTYPGGTTTVTYDVTTSPVVASDLAIWQTPTAQTFA